MRYSGGVGRVRFVRWPTLRATVPRVFLARAVAGVLVGAFVIVSALVLSGSQALAVVPAPPLAGPASATLTQVSAAEWRTTVYLDTAALCAGNKPRASSSAW